MRSRKQRLKGKKSRAQKRRAKERRGVRKRRQDAWDKEARIAMLERQGYDKRLEIDRYGHYV